MPKTFLYLTTALTTIVVLSLATAAPAAAGTSERVEVSNIKTGPRVGFFKTRGGHVHISKTRPPTASGHGWWETNIGPAVLADTTIRLQIKKGNSWVYTGSTGKRRSRSKENGSKDAVARALCKNLDRHPWRSIVDVDIVGYSDPPRKEITDPQPLFCGV